MGNPWSGHRAPVEERFWRYVRRTRGCWHWQGSKQAPWFYGRLGMPNRRVEYAHRVSWVIHYGAIPKGQFVLHRCDHPSCVNPKHLFLGTHQDNVADMLAKGRGSTPPRKRHTAAVIRAVRAATGQTKVIAAKFGMSTWHVYRVRTRQVWKHI